MTAKSQPVTVVIGASAGGLTALSELLTTIPPTTGAAFIVVVHLDPEHRSDLAQILASKTRMAVTQVGRTAPLESNHVYVIPPDRRLLITDHELSAVEFTEPRGHRTPIDTLFRSVAQQLGDGFAMILSGAGSDGALGVRAVKESGGIILVQAPEEAEYASMPQSALATGVVDIVLPVRELASRLTELIKAKQSSPAEQTNGLDEELLRRILVHLRVRTGHDFSKYKQSTIVRRVARRMQVTRSAELEDYFDYLRENADESQALLSDLLISVTTFFRDTSPFDTLSSRVLPGLFSRRDSRAPIRVWVCGCATGEEAYTIAILLLEEAARQEVRPPIQIFASDLDARALGSAREGRFPTAIEADVKEDRLRRFFVREGDHYRVRQEVRDIVLFAVHDLLKDPPFSHVDLISCRNVLIYLDRELQEQVCSTFHYALSPGGYLFLGSSETADQPPGLFRLVDRTSRLYQSTAKAGEKPRLLPRLLGPVRIHEQIPQVGRAVSPTTALNEATMHRRALEQAAPPSVLVDESHRVLHLSDNAGRFLLPPGGPLSGDISDLARPELRFELRSALHRVFEQGQATLSLPIPVRFNGAPHRVHLLVRPADENESLRNALVMFIEGEALESASLPAPYATDETVRRLTQELELTQSRLRTVREESDAANEELRAANEELQSINEEYRSTSEELETSKEELQSINEELQTVNTELKLKLETISRAHSDLQNLMAATDVGTLFLDSNLRIKRFTERATELFSITSSDEGRAITDFSHKLDYDDLIKDARSVLSDLVPIRREVHSRSGQWFDFRLRPYRTVDDKIDGVVITLMDITDRRHIEEALRASEASLLNEKRLIDLSQEPILVWDFDDGILTWNRGCETLYGYSRDEAIGQSRDRLLDTKVPESSLDELKATLLAGRSWAGELRQRSKAGAETVVESHIELVAQNGRRLVFESARDISQRKTWERRQKLLLGELTHRVKNTLTVVQAVAHQTMRTSDSAEEFVQRFDGRLAALANAHGLLVELQWRGADLAALVRQQLTPYISDAPGRMELQGKPVLLPASLATPLGLVLHELATNASKYGALATPSGKIRLTWATERGNEREHLRLVWTEVGGPEVLPPTRTGFGSTLIERSIPDAKVEREFDASGLVCRIELPLVKNPDEDVVE